MGIPGLTTYMTGQAQFFTKYRLRSTKVVIDGNSLKYFLFSQYRIDTLHGGDYDDNATKTKFFFEILRDCDVSAYVVFDGGHEPDDRKLRTLLQRCEDKIRRQKFIAKGRVETIMPLLTNEAMRRYMTEISVPFIVSEFEADYDIAILANDFGCPVLSQDSDFFVLPVENGYVPFDKLDFHLEKMKDPMGSGFLKYIPCMVYHPLKFTRQFPNLGINALPLLATLAGNDYVNASTFDRILQRVIGEAEEYDGLSVTQSRIVKCIELLKNVRSASDAIDVILSSVGKTKREQIREIVNRSTQYYTLRPEYCAFKLSHYFEKSVSETAKSSLTEVRSVDGRILPQWIIDGHRKGEVGNMLLNVFVKRRIMLKSLVEDHEQPSVFKCSLEIRRVIYSMVVKGFPFAIPNSTLEGDITSLLGDDRAITSSGRQSNTLVSIVGSDNFEVREVSTQDEFLYSVEEYIREGESMTHYLVVANLDFPSVLDVASLSLTQRKDIVSRALNVDLDQLKGFPDDQKFLLGTVIFWIRNSKPHVRSQHYKSLLACSVMLSVRAFKSRHHKGRVNREPSHTVFLPGSIEAALSKLSETNIKKILQNWTEFFNRINHNLKYPLDLSIVHAFQQFQAVLMCSLRLNQLLRHPFPALNPADVFKGTFLYKLTEALQLESDQDSFLHSKFLRGSSLCVLFRNMVETVSSLIVERKLSSTETEENIVSAPYKTSSSMHSASEHALKRAPDTKSESRRYHSSSREEREYREQSDFIDKIVRIVDRQNEHFSKLYFSSLSRPGGYNT